MIPGRHLKPKTGLARLPRHERGVMNPLEARFARWLDEQKLAGIVERYAFEVDKIRLARLCFYHPDFTVRFVSGEVVYYEVKGGLWTEHGKVKVKVAAALQQRRIVVARAKAKKDGGGWTFLEFREGFDRRQKELKIA